MAENSKIQWTDHTVNFWTGCKKVSEGCKYCYMYRDKERYGLDPKDVVQVQMKTINRVLNKANAGDKMFTCSWSDFFIEEADVWRDWAWDIIRSRPDLHWQILTKRPERIAECLPDDWGDGWDNVWLGVSVESEEFAHRIKTLALIPAKLRFLSIEPLIEPLEEKYEDFIFSYQDKIHWIIIGGESGNENGKYKYRACELEWIEYIIDNTPVGIPIFVKQFGTYLSKKLNLADRHGGNIEGFPEHLKIREFPTNT